AAALVVAGGALAPDAPAADPAATTQEPAGVSQGPSARPDDAMTAPAGEEQAADVGGSEAGTVIVATGPGAASTTADGAADGADAGGTAGPAEGVVVTGGALTDPVAVEPGPADPGAGDGPAAGDAPAAGETPGVTESGPGPAAHANEQAHRNATERAERNQAAAGG
ncbi:MAG: hypothetical protein ABW025_11145, partial [Cellulomonas sp.]